MVGQTRDSDSSNINFPLPRPPIPKHKKRIPYYKTEMCQNWLRDPRHFCEYGPQCDYAHGREELRARRLPSTYKTKPCRDFAATGKCRFDTRCHFKHTEDDDTVVRQVAAGDLKYSRLR